MPFDWTKISIDTGLLFILYMGIRFVWWMVEKFFSKLDEQNKIIIDKDKIDNDNDVALIEVLNSICIKVNNIDDGIKEIKNKFRKKER